MAYAYPPEESGSSPSLVPGVLHKGQGGISGASSRKGSDEKYDVLKEFKAKVEEDDNYIQFFQDRVRLEEEYIAGLNRLYSRSKAVDTLHDDAFRRDEKPSHRRAWDEVRDYTQREIQSREAMVGALKDSVVNDLLRLRDEQMRIRLGLKDSIRKANDMYDDYAKNHLTKLKRTYWQKCQALEDHKRQENAIALQAKLLADSPTSPVSTPLKEHPNAFTSHAYSALAPPESTGPLPPSANPAQSEVTFAPSSKDSLPEKGEKSEKKGRIRAGSASGGGENKSKEMFVDLAQQGKKGFKAMIEKFGGDKEHREKDDGFVVVPQGGDESSAPALQRRRSAARGDPSRGMGTMKGVRVKREADEADKAYREGVFHLESLRLQRDKLQTSGIRNLEAFNDDLNKRLMRSLEAYIDALQGTAATNGQATEVARKVIGEVNLDRDTWLFRQKLKAADSQRTMPIPYHNYYVGECRSLIFGVSLTDYDFARGDGSDHGRPPTIVEKCIAAIDERGLDAEGIYRISGRHAGVQKMIQDIELDENKFSFTESDDIFCISNVLKQYLRELPEPVFQVPQAERIKYTESRESHIENGFTALRSRLRRLAPIHQTTFQALIEHLHRIAANSAENKMDAKNLSVVFNAVVFGHDQIPSDVNLLAMHAKKDTLLEDIIEHCILLFTSDSPFKTATNLSPLEASGLDSASPVTAESAKAGSSRTKVQIGQAGSQAAPALPLRSTRPGVQPIPEISGPIDDPVMPVPSFTPDGELDLLFDPDHIPQSVRDRMEEPYHIRPLASTDLMRSHFGLLQTLTVAPPIAPSVYTTLFQQLKSCVDTYFILVIIDKTSDQMIAHGTVVLEKKFIHGGSIAGHIEDIVVDPNVRGGGLGKKLVVGLRELAVHMGAYKVNLGCKDDRIPFYDKCGFGRRANDLSYYRSPRDVTPSVSPSPGAAIPLPPGAASPHPHPETLLPPGMNPRTNTAVINLAEEGINEPQDAAGGSPKTFTTLSSESGVTYHFPTKVEDDVALPLPAASETHDSPLRNEVTSAETPGEVDAVSPESVLGLTKQDKGKGAATKATEGEAQ